MAIDPVIGSAKVEVSGDFSKLDRETQIAMRRVDQRLSSGMDDALKPLNETIRKRVDGEGLGENLGDEVIAGVRRTIRRGDDVEIPLHADLDPLEQDVSRGMDRVTERIRTDTDVIAPEIGERLARRSGADKAGREIGKRMSASMRKEIAGKAQAAIDAMYARVRAENEDFDRYIRQTGTALASHEQWLKIRVDHAALKKDIDKVSREWDLFDTSLNSALDKVDLLPAWRRIFGRLADDRGSVALGERAGQAAGGRARKGFEDGVRRGNLSSMMTKTIGTAFAGGALRAVLYSFGARAAVTLGGGLLGQLSTIGTALTGWVSTVLGGAGQALAGLGAAAGGTFATAFAGAYGTVLTSIAAVIPAVQGLKFAFKGMEKEEKKALEERLAAATKNLKGFGRAVRAELLPAVFDSLKALDKLVPTLNKFGTGLGTEAARLVREFTKMATSAEMITEIDTFLGNSTKYFGQLGDAAVRLASKILPAFNAISSVTKKFFDYVTEKADAAGRALERLSAGGEKSVLTTTLEKWFDRATRLVTVFGTFGRAIAKVFNIAADNLGDRFINSLQSMADSFSNFINRVSSDTGKDGLAQTLEDWYEKGVALAGAFGNLSKIILLFFDSAADAGGNFMQDFEAITDRWLAQFERFRDSGRLEDILKRWWEQGKNLLGVLGNLGGALLNILGVAAGANEDFLASFEKTTKKWRDWTESITGQNTLKQYFDEARPVVEETWGLLGDILGLFSGSFTGSTGNLLSFIKMIRNEWVPAIAEIQQNLRDSGIQDALYKVATAFARLMDVGGGAMNGFLTTMAFALTGLAKALELLGPLVPIFATFIGSMQALTLLKWAVMNGGLLKFASSAKSAATSALGLGAAGKQVGFFASMASKLNIALATLFAVQTANAIFGPKATDQVTAYTAALKDAKTAVEDIFAAQENRSSFLGQDLNAAENIRSQLRKDMGPLKKIGVELGDWLGFGWKQRAEEDVNGMLDAIAAMANAGEWQQAKSALDKTKNWFDNNGIDPAVWRDKVDEINELIGDIGTTQAGEGIQSLIDAGEWEAAARGLGTLQAELERANVDAETAAEAVGAYRDAIIEAAKGDTIALSFNVDAIDRGLESLKGVEEYFKDGRWTAAGRAAARDLKASLVDMDLGPTVQAELDAITKTLETFDPVKGKWTKEGLRLRAQVFAEADVASFNGVQNAIADAFGGTPGKDDYLTQIIAIKADPDNYNATTGELKDQWKEKVVELTLKGVEEAKKQLALISSPEPVKIDIQAGEFQYYNPATGTYERSGGKFDVLKDLRNPPPIEVDVDTETAQGKLDALLAKIRLTPPSVPLDFTVSKTAVQSTITTSLNGVTYKIPTSIANPDLLPARDFVATQTQNNPFYMTSSLVNPNLDPTRRWTFDTTQRNPFTINNKMGKPDMSPVAAAVRNQKPYEFAWKWAAKPTGGVPDGTGKKPTTSTAGSGSGSGTGTKTTPKKDSEVRYLTVINQYPEPETGSAGYAMGLRIGRSVGWIDPNEVY